MASKAPSLAAGTASAKSPPTTAAATVSGKATTKKSRRPKSSSALVTPPGASRSSSIRRMTVDKSVVDELLLVCGVIGTTDPENPDQLIPVTDCLNWLQDLQRALRRDDDQYRPISLLLGKWNVVEQKLLPLIQTCRYDTPMLLTIVKILVILTKPLADTTLRAGRMSIDPKKQSERVVQEQIALRENALEQSATLVQYKRIMAHSSKSKKKGSGVLSILVSLLAEPLSKTGTARTEADHLTIELVLHLFRNLLSAEPILKESTEASQATAQLHHELIAIFEQELVLDILLVVGQEMESRENEPYNLLLMELLHHLLRSQDPTAVARSNGASKPARRPQQQQRGAGGGGVGSLRFKLQREQQRLQPSNAPASLSRHSHFAGTLLVQKADGTKQYTSAFQPVAPTLEPRKKKNRKTDPFVGTGTISANHTISQDPVGPAALRAQRAINNFCQRFVQDCYGPVMKSLKNEFRRDSARLEDGDKVAFFRVIWFFCQWRRVAGGARHQPQASSEDTEDVTTTALGQLIFTMDVFTFNLVLTATDTFAQHKQYPRLAQTVALYSEMIHLLNAMYNSKDSTEQIMAMGLMDRLFYGNDPTDRLPGLLSKWKPGTTTRDYVCDLVEVCHMTLKLLDANAKSVASHDISKRTKSNDAVTRMKEAAADFEVTSYLTRKIITNQVVFMYTHLLSHYATNALHVNHRIIAFFLRLSKVQIASAESESADSDLPQNPLATQTVTLEPMLYNIQLILVLDSILNDTSIRNDKDYSSLLSFACKTIEGYAALAKKNPMLYVECLFRHAAPHRYCDAVANLYVNEELRMIAVKDLLIEANRMYETAEQDDDDEHELEFIDDRPPSASSTAPSKYDSSFPAGRYEDTTAGSIDKGESNSYSGNSETVSRSEKRKREGATGKDSSSPKTVSRQRFRKLTPEDSSDEELELGDRGPVQDPIRRKISRKVASADSSDEELEFDSGPSSVPQSKPMFAFEEDEDED